MIRPAWRKWEPHFPTGALQFATSSSSAAERHDAIVSINVLDIEDHRTRLPHALVTGLTHVQSIPLDCYIGLCQSLNLPMYAYMCGHLGKLPERLGV